jgi:prepilin-type N-terminal cleavage/methylation domain-containing protein
MGTTRRAFTLIELLLCIGVLSLLVGLMLPGLRGAREAARDVKCRAHLHSFGDGITQFALDHKEHLPGVYTWNDPGLQDWQRDWLSGTYGDRKAPTQLDTWQHGPSEGTIFPYVDSNAEIYRCPSLAVGEFGSGIGSNGKYDYTMIGGFGGARIDLMPISIRSTLWTDGDALNTVPFFVEEDPAFHLNRIHYAGSLAGQDRLGTHHSGGSNYTAIDGSVQRIPARLLEITAMSLVAPARAGAIGRTSGINIGIDPPTFGWWNSAR